MYLAANPCSKLLAFAVLLGLAQHIRAQSCEQQCDADPGLAQLLVCDGFRGDKRKHCRRGANVAHYIVCIRTCDLEFDVHAPEVVRAKNAACGWSSEGWQTGLRASTLACVLGFDLAVTRARDDQIFARGGRSSPSHAVRLDEEEQCAKLESLLVVHRGYLSAKAPQAFFGDARLEHLLGWGDLTTLYHAWRRLARSEGVISARDVQGLRQVHPQHAGVAGKLYRQVMRSAHPDKVPQMCCSRELASMLRDVMGEAGKMRDYITEASRPSDTER